MGKYTMNKEHHCKKCGASVKVVHTFERAENDVVLATKIKLAELAMKATLKIRDELCSTCMTPKQREIIEEFKKQLGTMQTVEELTNGIVWLANNHPGHGVKIMERETKPAEQTIVLPKEVNLLDGLFLILEQLRGIREALEADICQCGDDCDCDDDSKQE